MATIKQRATAPNVPARRPFAVIGYSAADSVWCPTCLRFAAGLSPGRPDYDGKPILPLYARDPTMHEQTCDYCHKSLLTLLAQPKPKTPSTTVTAYLRTYYNRAALDFDGPPPLEVRNALKAAGWRWDPRHRLWWSTVKDPQVPPNVTLPAPSVPVAAKAPIIRRRGTMLV